MVLSAPLPPQRALLSPSRKRVLSPFQHELKRHKVSVSPRASDANV
jgi:hypothetical protein